MAISQNRSCQAGGAVSFVTF